MPLQAAPCVVDNLAGITPGCRVYVQVEVKPLVFANPAEKLYKRPIALSLDYDKDDASALDTTPPRHRDSPESRDAAKHACPIFGIEMDIAPQTSYVLGAVYPRGTAVVFFDDEDLFLLQFVEQADVV